jgi:hypothetical protein
MKNDIATPLILEGYSKTPSSVGAYCLKLRYSGALKTMNTPSSGSLVACYESLGKRQLEEVIKKREQV